MEEIKKIAEKYYGDIPYHNFKHALKVFENCKFYIERCKKYKIEVNSDVVLIAALFHDAGFHEKTDYKTKERYSISIVEKELKKLGYSDSFIKEVGNCILATEPYGNFEKTEQKILRAADLKGLMSSYDNFEKQTKLIRQEYSILHPGKDFPLKKWAELLKPYASRTIKLTPEFHKDDWHRKFEENLKRYLKENS
jgi:predicted metal-dependent HD superfamily phosphohydrolase